jgi:conserved oligomeric Golgi complex subunit 3
VLQAKLHSCDMILEKTSSLLSTLDNLKLGFNAVAEQTSAFQAQCNTLVEEEEQLSSYADKLAETLQPFESLEPITRQLNAPGADIVTKPDFIESLKRLDQGLVFFRSNVRPSNCVH